MSRREQWRLLFLIVPLGLVIIAIGRLRDPAVGQRLNAVFAQVSSSAPAPNQSVAPPEKLFTGVDPEWIKTIADNTYFRNSETAAWFGMFAALKKVPDEIVKELAAPEVGYVQLVAQPGAYRGKLIGISGYVRQITEQKPAENDLGISSYYRLVLQPTDGSAWPIFIYTLSLPAGISPNHLPTEGYAKVVGLFFKNLSYDYSGGLGTAPVIVAKTVDVVQGVPSDQSSKDIHMDERPVKVDELNNAAVDQAVGQAPDKSLGNAVLRNLRFDEKLMKVVTSRGPLRAEDHEAFYQLLKAVGQIGPNQLARFAQQNLPAVRDEWQRRLDTADTSAQRSLAQASLRSATQGRYNVAPLFNDAANQQGRLFVFDGIARRALRVEVGTTPIEGESGNAAHFGFDHYYELEVFTDDSQNHPLVFCVRELPPGFPTGDSLREPVRIAGFFFKAWLYRARGIATDDDPSKSDSNAGDVDPARYAPLLIGRAPIRLLPAEQGPALSRYVGVGLFLVGLAGVTVAAVVFGRGDRQFRRRTRAMDYTLPEGQSLNDLQVPEGDSDEKTKLPLQPTIGDVS